LKEEQTHHVERADEVDANDLLERRKRKRAILAENLHRRADARAIDENARCPKFRRDRCHRRLAGYSIRDVDCKRPSARALRYGVRCIGIEIEHGDLGAALGELDGGGPDPPPVTIATLKRWRRTVGRSGPGAGQATDRIAWSVRLGRGTLKWRIAAHALTIS